MQTNALVSATAPLLATARPLRIARLGRDRRVIAGAVFGMIAVATAWQWSWLVAIGVAPLLLSVAPCAAMCGLGLCMHRMDGRACSPTPQDGETVRGTLDNPSTTEET